MKKTDFKTDLFYTFFLWVLICQLIAYLTQNRFFPGYSEYLYENIGNYIPSIRRMDKVSFFDNTIAKQCASTIFVTTPLLFMSLFLTDTKSTIAGIIKNKKINSSSFVFFAVGCLALFGGLNTSGPGNIFRNSIYGFSLLGAGVTFLSAYCFRISLALQLINKEAVWEQ